MANEQTKQLPEAAEKSMLRSKTKYVAEVCFGFATKKSVYKRGWKEGYEYSQQENKELKEQRDKYQELLGNSQIGLRKSNLQRDELLKTLEGMTDFYMNEVTTNREIFWQLPVNKFYNAAAILLKKYSTKQDQK